MAIGDTGFVHINSQMLGIGNISLPFMDDVEIDSPVGPGVTVSPSFPLQNSINH
jgi:hypothetical protein